MDRSAVQVFLEAPGALVEAVGAEECMDHVVALHAFIAPAAHDLLGVAELGLKEGLVVVPDDLVVSDGGE
jgi:hypothetical protein